MSRREFDESMAKVNAAMKTSKRDVRRYRWQIYGLYGVKRREAWALGAIERNARGPLGWYARRIRDRLLREDGQP